MIKKLKSKWEILVILVLGLTPLLWYKLPNSLALGHDMGFPVNPINFFIDRLFLWTDRVGLGWDQTLGSAAILIHGLEALLFSLGFSIFSVQKIVFIFWFVLPGLTMYYFVSRIHKDKNEWFLRLSASIFYMFNHFLLQGWFIAERTKFSLYAALPLHLSFLIRMIQGELSILKGIALMSLVFFFLNGGGGLPLYGGLLLTLGVAYLFFGFIQIKKKKSDIKRLILIALSIPISFFLANFYWIFPTFIKTFSSYSDSLSSIGGITSVIEWSGEVSRFASLQNVARLQGIPDWYDNSLHPYSKYFLENPVLLLVSFLIPVIVFSSLFLLKKLPEYKNLIIYFNILAILGIIFTAGSHPPFGFIYNLMLSYIPGFAIFRSGFYKFAPALWFSYAYLFSFAIFFIITRKKNIKENFRNIIFLSVLIGILIYNFPYFNGIFFNWRAPFSTMTTLPTYVREFSQWSNSNLTNNDRILTFPEKNKGWNTYAYNWGYWSTAPIESLFTDKSIVSNDKVLSPVEKKYTENIYDSILEGTDDYNRPLEILGINYFVLQNDFFFKAPKMQTINPETYKDRFFSLNISKDEEFGEWEVYKLRNNPKRLFADANPQMIIGSNEILENQFMDIENVLKIPEVSNFYFTNEIIKEDVFTNEIQIKNCLFCDKENQHFTLYPPESKILPDSFLYPLVLRREEGQRKLMTRNLNQNIDFSLGTSLKRIGEVKVMVSRKRNINEIQETLNNLSRELDNISESLDSLDKNSNASQLMILRINNFLEEEQRLIDEIGEQGSKEINSMMIPVSEKIAQIYQKNEKFQYTYPQENQKIYFFNLENEGQRELLVRNESEKNKISIVKVFIDENEEEFESLEKKGYTSLGTFNLSKGEHEITLETENFENLLDESKMYKDGCYNYEVTKIHPNKIYKLNFDFKGIDFSTNKRSFVKIEQSSRDEKFSGRIKFSEVASADRFESKITTSNQTKSILISICPPSGKVSDLSLSNVVFREFLTPTALLVSNRREDLITPEIKVNENSKTNFDVNINEAKNSFLLVMNNEFNSNWQLSYEDGSINSKHIRVNGFANGWIIEKPGTYNLKINYKPQKYFYIGLLITIFYMILVVIYIFRKRDETH